MLVVVQFPLADSRAFVNSETYRLKSPAWPSPEPGKEFIRVSGVVKQRRRGGLDDWSGEGIYCSARRALRFQPRLGRQPVGVFGTSLSFASVFRRFLYDGVAVSRIEVGLRVREVEGGYVFPFNERDCFNFIEACLSIPVMVPSGKDALASCELGNCSRLLSKHYLYSTTEQVGGALAPVADWWLYPGMPLLLIEYEDEEILQLPKYSRLVEPIPFYDILHYCQIERAGKRLGVWFLRRKPDDLDRVRRLRIHLFRLHAERECLKQILRLLSRSNLQPGDRTPSSDRLQKYLRDSMRLLSPDTHYGFSQSNILEAAQEFENIVTPGERTTLLAQLLNIRKNIYHGLEEFTLPGSDTTGKIHVIAQNVTIIEGEAKNIGGVSMTSYQINFGDNAKISGDFVVANTIQNSFNKISSSEVSEDLKAKFKELSEVVAEMSNHLPQDKARTAARDIEILTNEALSEHPRREWYELSAKGLIEAAKTVAQFTTTVTNAVKAVLALIV